MTKKKLKYGNVYEDFTAKTLSFRDYFFFILKMARYSCEIYKKKVPF